MHILYTFGVSRVNRKKHAGTIFLMLGKWWRWQEIDTRAGAAAINALILRGNSAEAAPLVRERSRVQSSPTAP
jgi:hypothetical protein